jgi:ATP-dependent Clp protease ATP-binding subunit ClpC
MFERYTERARKVIFFARYEASQMGSAEIENEHLLLGLIREGHELTNKLFFLSRVQTEDVKKELDRHMVRKEKVSTSVEIPLSNQSKRVLALASQIADELRHKYIGTEHILLAILREQNSLASRILHVHGMSFASTKNDVLELLREKVDTTKKKDGTILTEFGRDLTDLAAKSLLDPLIGRETELERLVHILCRRTKNNPVLIGEPGVGKTAIVEGMAQKIVTGDVPSFLLDKKILALDISSIVAGTKYRGQFEERMKSIIKELKETENVIIYMDELHTIVGAGSAEGSLDAAGILKPSLSRGEIQCVGATTPKEYRKYIEKDRALERRFQEVRVNPPNEEDCIDILTGIKDRYEQYHQVKYEKEALTSAVMQSNRYITNRYLPDKAIDVLDEAGARVKLRTNTMPKELRKAELKLHEINGQMEKAISLKEFEEAAFFRDQEEIQREVISRLKQELTKNGTLKMNVTAEDINRVVSDWTGIPVASIQKEEMDKLLNMEQELHKRIIGQDEAIQAISQAIRRSRAGLKAHRKPVGSFIFLGPTGVGKTEVARQLAQFLFGDQKFLIRFDMSEYMEKHSISKLIGSPPGYVGYEEGGQLTDKVKQNPYSVILLDEIEKAHPNIFNILLQVFEDGQLTDGLGNTIDFKNTIIIMTSNIGAKHIQKRSTMGFFNETEEADYEQMKDIVKREIKQTFNPEFINRLDGFITFRPLTEDELVQIVHLMIEDVNANLKENDLKLEVGEDVCRWFVEKTCQDRSYGARPLQRAIQKYIEDALAEDILRGNLKKSGVIKVKPNKQELTFELVSSTT